MVFVAQCNGWVLLVINITEADIIPPLIVAVSSQTLGNEGARDDRKGEKGGRQERNNRKGKGKESLCQCSSPTGAPVKRIEHIGRAR